MCEGLKNEVRLRLLARKMQFSGPTLRSLANFFIELLVVRFAVNFRRPLRVYGQQACSLNDYTRVLYFLA